MDRDASETFNNSNIEKQVAYYFTGKRLVFSQQCSRRGIVSVTYRLALQRDDETQRKRRRETTGTERKRERLLADRY